MAYCPPGRDFSLGSDPRALPSVTHGSALQAPERMRKSCDLTTHPHRTDASHSTLLPGGQYARGKGRFILVYRLAMDAKTRKGDDGAD